jgi:UDP-N-acetylmuramate dehydrogenase
MEQSVMEKHSVVQGHPGLQGHPVIRGNIIVQASMKRYTSMKVGGAAPYLIYPRDEQDVLAAMEWLSEWKLPVRFFGNGTNVIVSDEGIGYGLIRITRMRHLSFIPAGDGVIVEVSGGFSLKTLIRECVRRGYGGLEKLYGIPGTVGGAVKMNAGSFGVCVSDHLLSVRLVSSGGAIRKVAKKDLGFGYRHSSLKPDEGVLEAAFELKADDPVRIKADMDYVWKERLDKHPMDLPSAGSVFKNALVAPCWKYIDMAGCRGLRVGGAAVCEKHANFIVNTGNANASDVKGLIAAVKDCVREATGILLEEEVEFWGFDVHER